MIKLFIFAFLLESFGVCGKLKMSDPMPPTIEASLSHVNKPTLTVAYITNYGGVCGMGPLASEGTKLALDLAYNASLLPDYNLAFKMYDDNCDLPLGVKTIAELMKSVDQQEQNVFPLMVGPIIDSNAYSGMFIQYYNFVAVTGLSARSTQFTDRNRYNSFHVASPSFEIWYHAIPPFLKANGWNRVYVLTDSWNFWTPYLEALYLSLDQYNISLDGVSKLAFAEGENPSEEQFEKAIRELAVFDPRIVVVSSQFGPLYACWLHRRGMYGPNYVYIMYGIGYFESDTSFRAKDCTDQMLFDFQQSAIYYYFASPLLSNPEGTDVFGLTGQKFDQYLKTIIEKPSENGALWFSLRGYGYNQATAAILTLDVLEKTLRKNKDTLINWTTNSTNFKQNGSYIRSQLISHLDKLRFKQMTSNEEAINARTGQTAFFQVQFNKETQKNEPVPVASFDTSPSGKKFGKVTFGPKPFVWNTWDGMVPTDSVRIYGYVDPIMGLKANVAIKVLAALMIVANTAFLILDISAKDKSLQSLDSSRNGSLVAIGLLPKIGTVLMLIGVLILPIDGDMASPHWNCMAASFFIISGFSLLTSAFVAKLFVATLCKQLQEKQEVAEANNRAAYQTHLAPSNRISRNSNSKPSSDNGIQQPAQAHQQSMASTASTRQQLVPVISESLAIGPAKVALPTVIVWTLLQIVIMVAWFGAAPIEVARFDGIMEELDISRKYQHFTMACNLPPQSFGFMLGHLVCYVLILMFSLYYAVALRNARLSANARELVDTHVIRMAGYSVGVFALIGGAVALLFYSPKPNELQASVAGIILSISALVTAATNYATVRRNYTR